MHADQLTLSLVGFEGTWSEGLSFFALAGLAWLLTYALHSSLLLGSAWLATRRLATSRAGLRERIWKFAVLAAFVTASLQVGLGFEPLGGRLPLRRNAVASAAAASEAPDTPAARSDFSAPEDSPAWPKLVARDVLASLLATSSGDAPDANASLTRSEPREATEDRIAPPSMAEATPSPLLSAAAVPWDSSLGEWTQWAFAVCLSGALGGLLLFTLLWVRLNGCLRDRVALEHGALADKLRELCARAHIKRRVRLSVAPSLGAPISMGMFKAEICVPPRVLLELNEEEQEVLLAHELAHVVRRDPLWLAVCRLCEGVFFFQPLNRVARREIEDCAEFLSDAWAVRQTGLRFSLASCLTRIAEWIVGERRVLPAPAMAQGRSRLRHRVELLLDEGSAREVDRSPAWLGVACLGFGATLIAVVPCVSASEALLDAGDRGGLLFLPDRNASTRSVADNADCEAEGEPTTEACNDVAAEVAEVPAPDGFGELQFELNALAAEMLLLRAEAEKLDLHGDLAGEITAELQLLEMKLARLRDLGSRFESLRASAMSGSRAKNQPATETDQGLARTALPKNTDSTTSTISEETK